MHVTNTFAACKKNTPRSSLALRVGRVARLVTLVATTKMDWTSSANLARLRRRQLHRRRLLHLRLGWLWLLLRNPTLIVAQGGERPRRQFMQE